MAKKEKKVENIVKLQIPAGQANPSPPVGPALGARNPPSTVRLSCRAFDSLTDAIIPHLTCQSTPTKAKGSATESELWLLSQGRLV